MCSLCHSCFEKCVSISHFAHLLSFAFLKNNKLFCELKDFYANFGVPSPFTDSILQNSQKIGGMETQLVSWRGRERERERERDRESQSEMGRDVERDRVRGASKDGSVIPPLQMTALRYNQYVTVKCSQLNVFSQTFACRSSQVAYVLP